MAARAADRTSSSRRQLQRNFDQAAVGGCGGPSKGSRIWGEEVRPQHPAPEPVHGTFGISTPRSQATEDRDQRVRWGHEDPGGDEESRAGEPELRPVPKFQQAACTHMLFVNFALVGS